MGKFKVVVFLELITKKIPILHYIKGDENIKNFWLKIHLRNMDVTFDTLNEFYLKNDLALIWNKQLVKIKEETILKYNIKTGYDLFLASCYKGFEDKQFTIGACSEGAETYEVVEMTQEEFEKPKGELMSPYAYELLEGNEEPKRSKYSYYNPITNEFISK